MASADKTVRMRRLVCAFLVRIQQKPGLPIVLIIDQNVVLGPYPDGI